VIKTDSYVLAVSLLARCFGSHLDLQMKMNFSPKKSYFIEDLQTILSAK